MKSFSKGKSFGGDRRGGDRFGGKKDFGGRSSFGGPKPWENKGKSRSFGGDGRTDMYPAVCGDCGASCEVPFRPNGEKPVLCNDCFGGNKGGDRGSRDTRGGSFERRDFGSKRSFDRPAPSFDRGNTNDTVSKQLAEMNGKLDRLIEALSQSARAIAPAAIRAESKPTTQSAKKAPAKKAAKVEKTVTKKAATKKVAKKAPAKKTAAKKKK